MSSQEAPDPKIELVSEPPEPKPTKVPSCSPPELLGTATKILEAIERTRERSLFVLIARNIGEETCQEVYRWRSELKRAGDDDKLDILIHSPGGELNSCYQLARLLSRRTNAWEALVPSMAASGATLICLGSSTIVMSEIAQLGPIDPQVISKSQQKFFAGERQSPLEAFQAVKYLREFGLTALDATMMFLLNHGVAPKPALETAG